MRSCAHYRCSTPDPAEAHQEVVALGNGVCVSIRHFKFISFAVNLIFYDIHVGSGEMDVLMNICVILLSVLCLSSGLYFHIGETEKKCFIEDIPDDTMVVGKALFLSESVCISLLYEVGLP